MKECSLYSYSWVDVFKGLAAGNMVIKSQEKRLEDSQPNSLWRGGSGRGVAELSGNSACLPKGRSRAQISARSDPGRDSLLSNSDGDSGEFLRVIVQYQRGVTTKHRKKYTKRNALDKQACRLDGWRGQNVVGYRQARMPN